MPKITLSPEEEEDNLIRSVALANDYSETAELYDKDGVPKTRVFSTEEPVQFRRMLHALQQWLHKGSGDIREMNLETSDRRALNKYMGQFRARVEINGSFSVSDYPQPWNEALLQFVRLLNNSQLDLLGGPCRNRKKHEDRDHWYLKKTRRPSIFCSPLCAGDATKANERKKAYDKKIAKATAAIKNYPKRPAKFNKLSWQEWVIEDSRPARGQKPSTSKKFLTMAVKSGRLTPPGEWAEHQSFAVK